jgi:hypothetical protein
MRSCSLSWGRWGFGCRTCRSCRPAQGCRRDRLSPPRSARSHGPGLARGSNLCAVCAAQRERRRGAIEDGGSRDGEDQQPPPIRPDQRQDPHVGVNRYRVQRPGPPTVDRPPSPQGIGRRRQHGLPGRRDHRRIGPIRGRWGPASEPGGSGIWRTLIPASVDSHTAGTVARSPDRNRSRAAVARLWPARSDGHRGHRGHNRGTAARPTGALNRRRLVAAGTGLTG